MAKQQQQQRSRKEKHEFGPRDIPELSGKNIANLPNKNNKNHKSSEEAREYARSLKLKNQKGWQKYC